MRFTLLPQKGNSSGRKRLPRSSKILLVMKLATLFLFLAFMQVSANGLAQKVTLSGNNVSLKKVFHEIHKQTGYHFLCTKEQLTSSTKVDVKLKNVQLKNALKTIFEQQPLAYEIANRTIIVRKEDKTGRKQTLRKQLKTIHGTVVDSATGEPLVGVSVKVKGKQKGTVTDVNGSFSLDVSDESTLEVSFVGYTTQNIEVESQNSFTIRLATSSTGLDQLIVVGYSTQSKRNITGAVDQISGEELTSRPMTNLNQGLQGVSPNVNIDIQNGKPFAKPTINIRGTTSIGQGGSALVLIDGVEGDPSMINPNDIQSISVLKGPAASAEYGARAAFGVIQITTKRGVDNGFSINVSARVGLKQPAVKPGFVTDGYTYVKNFYKAYQNGQGFVPKNINKTQPFSLDYLKEFKRHHEDPSLPDVVVDDNGNYVYYTSTDWYHKLYKSQLTNQVYNFSASAGNEKARFIVSGRYQGQEGLFRYNSDDYNMYNVRAKGEIKLFSWLKLSNNFSYAKRLYFNPLNVGEGGGIWRNLQDEGHPSAPMLNPDGTITFSGAYTVGDFYYGKNGKGFNNQVLSDKIQLEGDFFDHKLSLIGNFSYKNIRNDIKEKRVPVPYSKAKGQTTLLGSNQNNLALTRGNTNYYALNFYGEYTNTFGVGHNVDLTVGSNYERQQYDEIYLKRNGLAFEDAENINLALGDGISTSGQYNAWNLLGVFYQLNYNYKHRYLVTLSGRYDGNSKFPSDQRFGFFPSFSAGWFLSEEPFWHISKDLVSGLKIRASYGSLGNGNISPYTYQQQLPIDKISNIIAGEQPQAISMPNVLPEGLTWETVTTSDIGLDLWMFTNRLSVSGDVYIRNTTNMFTTALTPPRVFGASTPKGNYADLRTTGWEIKVDWSDQINNVGGKKLSYKIGFNVGDNKAKITRFNNPEKNLDDYYVGEEVGEIWGYVTEGIFQSQEEVKKHADQNKFLSSHSPDGTFGIGNLKYKDLNGDGEINDGQNRVSNPGDRRVIGNSNARYRFGANIHLSWNNFFISAFFQGVGQRDWYPSSEADNFWGQYNRPYNQLPKWQLKNGMIWSKDNPDGFLPKYTGYEALEADLSNPQTRYLMNVAYIRLSNLGIGYTVHSDGLSNAGIKDIRISLDGQNLWMYTPLQKIAPNIDPENGISKSEADVSGGTAGDGLNYPILRSLSLGVSITF